MESRLRRATMFWKSLMLAMLVLGFVLFGYTVGHVEELPQLPDEMILPLVSQKATPGSTEKLVSTFSKLRTLSEDYLLESDPNKLVSIENDVSIQLNEINHELESLGETNDVGMEILVANLMRLKRDFEKDIRLSFKLHRTELGMNK